jgi:hypothetical protein
LISFTSERRIKKGIYRLDFENNTFGFLNDYHRESFMFNYSPNYNYLHYYHREKYDISYSAQIYDIRNSKVVYSERISDVGDLIFKDNHVFFHESLPILFRQNQKGQLKLINYEKGKLLATLKLLKDGNWLAYTPDGLIDGTQLGRESFYYLFGHEIITSDQIKDFFWETNLLQKLIKQPDSSFIKNNFALELYPKPFLELINEKGKIKIKLEARSGGIGKVALYINNKEVKTDINPKRKRKFTFQLNDFKDYFHENNVNQIGIKSYNKKGVISSKLQEIYLHIDATKSKGTSKDLTYNTDSRPIRNVMPKKVNLYGIFVGTSKYSDESLNLDWADNDARDLMNGFNKIKKDMYKIDSTSFHILTSIPDSTELFSTKENILKAFKHVEENATANDIIVIFLSGHGITIGDDFYYMTGSAGGKDIEKNESTRELTCISSKEINEALRSIKSNKQVLIIDACHSGQIAKILENKSRNMSSSQKKALEYLEDKMGVYILASSESNQKSYESDIFNQGLLTYSLLLGMSGEAAKNDVLYVTDLLSYASNKAEEIGKKIKKIQRPVLGISKGGSSFPLGFKSDSLDIAIPEGKSKISISNFGSDGLFNDPLELNHIINQYFKELGAIGSKSNFIFINKQNEKDSYTFSGLYSKLNDDKYNLKYYILKDNIKIGGPFSIDFNDLSIEKNRRALGVDLYSNLRDLR